jgi:hypothetical protein
MWASGLSDSITGTFSAVHNVFHVTQLKKGMPVPENEVITEAHSWIEPDFSLIEHPLRVLDQKERKTRRQTVRIEDQERPGGRWMTAPQ